MISTGAGAEMRQTLGTAVFSGMLGVTLFGIFLTPVFWTPGSLPSRELFVHLNPFSYLIDIVRMPLLGQTPPWSMWLVLVGMNLASAFTAIIFFARYRARIAYWV